MAQIKPAVFVGNGPNFEILRILSDNDTLAGVVNNSEFVNNSVMLRNTGGVLGAVVVPSGSLLANVGSGIGAVTLADFAASLATSAFDATGSSGEILVHNGTKVTVFGPATNGYLVAFDSNSPTGLVAVAPAAAGVALFSDLTDTPVDYTAADGFFVKVSGNGLIFEEVNPTGLDLGSSDLTIDLTGGDTFRTLDLNGKTLKIREELNGNFTTLDVQPGHPLTTNVADNLATFGRVDALALYGGNGSQLSVAAEGMALEFFGAGQMLLGDGTSSNYVAPQEGEAMVGDATGKLVWASHAPLAATLTQPESDRTFYQLAADAVWEDELASGSYYSLYTFGSLASSTVPTMPDAGTRAWTFKVERQNADGTVGNVTATSNYVDQEGGPLRPRTFTAALTRQIADTAWTAGSWFETTSQFMDGSEFQSQQRFAQKELWLKIGDSNAKGAESGVEPALGVFDPFDEDGVHPKVWEVSRGINAARYLTAPTGEPHLLRAPAADDAQGIGLGQWFGKRRVQVFPEIERIVMYNNGNEGKGLVRRIGTAVGLDWWSASGSNVEVEPGVLVEEGTGYRETVDAVNVFLAKNPEYRVAGILFVNGVADGGNFITQVNYESVLANMVAGFRSEIVGAEDAAFLIAGPPQGYIEDTGSPNTIQEIDVAHRRVAEYITNSAFVDMSDVPTSVDNPVHYGYEALRLLGKRMAVASANLYKAQKQIGVPSYRFKFTGSQFRDVADGGGRIFSQRLANDPERGVVLTTELRDGAYTGFDTDITLDPRKYTKALWVKSFDDATGSNPVTPTSFLSGGDDASGQNHIMSLVSNGHNSAAGQTAPGIADLDAGVWTHLALTFDGTSFNLYRNGVLSAGSPYTDDTAFGVGGGEELMSVAIGYYSGALDGWDFKGYIDDVCVYPEALPAAGIVALHLEGIVEAPPGRPDKLETLTTNKTLSRDDVNAILAVDTAGVVNLAVPNEFDKHVIIGSEIRILNVGTGSVTLTPEATTPFGSTPVTIDGSTDTITVIDPFALVSLIKITQNDWKLVRYEEEDRRIVPHPTDTVPIKMFAINSFDVDIGTTGVGVPLPSTISTDEWFQVLLPGAYTVRIDSINYANQNSGAFAELRTFRGTGSAVAGSKIVEIASEQQVRPPTNSLLFLSAAQTLLPVNDASSGNNGAFYHILAAGIAADYTLPAISSLIPAAGTGRVSVSCDWAARDAGIGVFAPTGGDTITNLADLPTTGTQRVHFLANSASNDWIVLSA